MRVVDKFPRIADLDYLRVIRGALIATIDTRPSRA
jgi:hypothetical protein